MGYVITIKYHEANKDGTFGFNVNDPREKTIKVGKPGEDVPKKDLAAIILKQASRLDIKVFDIEITEFVRKTINVRQSHDGIVIGNRKFKLDRDIQVSCMIVDEEQPPQITPPSPQQPNMTSSTPRLTNRPTKTTGKREFFVPSEDLLRAKPKIVEKFRQQGLMFGQQYEIFEEKTREDGEMMYVVFNNAGQMTAVESMHFSAVPPGQLIDSKTGRIENTLSNDKLSVPGGEWHDRVPEIRRT